MLSYGTSDCVEFNTKNEDLSTINKTYDRLYDSTAYADGNFKIYTGKIYKDRIYTENIQVNR